MDLDTLYYSSPEVQRNIEVRSHIPDYKRRRQAEELEAKKWWLLNHGISKRQIEATYWKFKTYVYYN